jgi:hypothetical protein
MDGGGYGGGGCCHLGPGDTIANSGGAMVALTGEGSQALRSDIYDADSSYEGGEAWWAHLGGL